MCMRAWLVTPVTPPGKTDVYRPSIYGFVLLALMALANPDLVMASTTEDRAKVTYLVGSSVYIDAGKDSGLLPDQSVEVLRDGELIAILKVVYVSSGRASCTVIKADGEIVLGDIVRFVPSLVPAERSAGGIKQEPQSRGAKDKSRIREMGFRGRIGARYYAVLDNGGSGEHYSQPAMDFRLDGTQIGGSRFNVHLDLRARRTYRTRTSGEKDTAGRTRVYRMSAERRGRLRYSLGRQFSPNLSSVSLFDGGLLELLQTRSTIGIFVGTQPDPLTFGFSDETVEYGFYSQIKSPPADTHRWFVTTGALGSYVHGVSNREYLFLRGQYQTKALYTYLNQEIDINRGWKTDFETGRLSFTSTHFVVRYRIDRMTLRAGYDTRRSVRLYRDRDTPESEFDDSHRQGVRAGVDAKLGDKLTVGTDTRFNGGAFGGNSRSYSLTARGNSLYRHNLQMSSRITRYTSDRVKGWLGSVSAGARIARQHRAEIHAGFEG